MQWKLYVAGLTVLLLVGESVQAGPFGLFQGRRNRMNNNSDSGMVAQPVATTPVAAATDTAPAATVATVPATQMYQPVSNNSSSRRGGRLFGRRNGGGGGTYSEPMTMIQPASTTIVANAPATERMPAPSIASGTTTASTTTTVSYQPVTYSSGLRGRRSYTVWEPVTMIQPVATAPASAESATVSAPIYSTQPISSSTGRTGLFGRRRGGSDMPVNTVVTTPGATTRQAFYGPGAQTALIDIRLPIATAEIFFNGTRTNQTGISRLFVTPALDPQKDNTYEVKAKWIENGEQKERTETVKVPAGGRILVDFTTSPR
jgi:uncharacterized protein (TIGR03000 family)